jgi:branched-chain amino acid transport system ATP-binding protein
MSAILVAQHLSKRFGGLCAVDECSIEVRRGSITGLIGPNGAGKTTLFNLLTGFLHPDSGRVEFKGEDVTGLQPHTIFSRRMCRTFQIPREFKELSVLENVMVVAKGQLGEHLWAPWLVPGRVRRQEAEVRARAAELLGLVGLASLADAPAWTLSGGQKKLLELGRAMMGDPELLLLDEPGAGINPSEMRSLLDDIQRIAAERAVTIFLIEHHMDVVMSICDHVIVMTQGRKLAEGPPDAIRRDPRVREAYLGPKYSWHS